MTYQPKQLLIDADILLYRAMISVEKEFDLGNDIWTLHADLKEAKWLLNEIIHQIDEDTELPTEDAVFALSCPEHRFRKALVEDYKGNRVNVRKPLGYNELRAYLVDRFDTVTYYGLEGDDVMGILATQKPEHYLLHTLDKDLKQIPGAHWDEDHIVHRDLKECDEFFYTQVIAGDPTDGYYGAPGFGMTSAAKLVENLQKPEIYEHELKSGPRKGLIEERKRNVPAETYWEIVKACYETNGMTEAHALNNAYLARILRDGEYDFSTKTVNLFKPNKEPLT